MNLIILNNLKYQQESWQHVYGRNQKRYNAQEINQIDQVGQIFNREFELNIWIIE